MMTKMIVLSFLVMGMTVKKVTCSLLFGFGLSFSPLGLIY